MARAFSPGSSLRSNLGRCPRLVWAAPLALRNDVPNRILMRLPWGRMQFGGAGHESYRKSGGFGEKSILLVASKECLVAAMPRRASASSFPGAVAFGRRGVNPPMPRAYSPYPLGARSPGVALRSTQGCDAARAVGAPRNTTFNPSSADK